MIILYFIIYLFCESFLKPNEILIWIYETYIYIYIIKQFYYIEWIMLIYWYDVLIPMSIGYK